MPNKTEAYHALQHHMTRANDLEGLSLLIDLMLSGQDGTVEYTSKARNGRGRGLSVGGGGGAVTVNPDLGTVTVNPEAGA